MRFSSRLLFFGFATISVLLGTNLSEARNYPRRRPLNTLTPTTASGNSANDNAPSDMLGTFYSTPMLNTSGGSPLGRYNTSSLILYSPISPLRSFAAPVNVYSRGYDGVTTETEATTTTNALLPLPQPVQYPTVNSSYYKPRTRTTTTPPWWQNGINWVDQN